MLAIPTIPVDAASVVLITLSHLTSPTYLLTYPSRLILAWAGAFFFSLRFTRQTYVQMDRWTDGRTRKIVYTYTLLFPLHSSPFLLLFSRDWTHGFLLFASLHFEALGSA